MQVLEQIDTPEARQVLQIIANGARQSILADEAKKALTRLGRHKA